ncbi:MAG TPA: choice-of-anchor tandem repeat GloVer-containing protein [Terriglobales bacterium]|nr:choice-of-anchor tandem repeat GloVer-containing protein [Terriglobales bacterium]
MKTRELYVEVGRLRKSGLGWKRNSNRRSVSGLSTLAVLASLCACFLAFAHPAQGQTYQVLYTFCSQTNCTDGATPNPNLVIDKAGNLYGTTQQGGDSLSTEGIAFKISPSGAEEVLFNFENLSTGVQPMGGLILDADGNLYGTASVGGYVQKRKNCGSTGCGLVFELSPSGGETILHDFINTLTWQGRFPFGPLVRDANGNLFGLVNGFGQATQGGLFELKTDGSESVLYWFGGSKAPKDPNPGLLMDAQGDIYGTSNSGGAHHAGAVFEINPAGEETTLYSFGNKKALQYGTRPAAGLVMDTSGNFYGTTSGEDSYGASFGTVFQLPPGQTSPKLLYAFQGQPDGSSPIGSLLRDAEGNLYGTTYWGGVYDQGAVYKLSPAGVETVLYSFSGGTDGANPMGGLTMDGQGNLYGTTLRGGNTQCPKYNGGCGVVFKVTP